MNIYFDRIYTRFYNYRLESLIIITLPSLSTKVTVYSNQPEGELFAKRAELIQPIQEKVYNAINQVALTKNYAFVFDKAAGTTMLYCSDKNDISDEILLKLGYLNR